MPRFAIVGAGPTGLAAYHELIDLGISGSDVALIDPGVMREGKPNTGALSPLLTHESFKSATAGGALAKPNGPDLGAEVELSDGICNYRPAEYWGSSCLPMPTWSSHGIYESPQFVSAYAKTVKRWGVQAEASSLHDVYPITGETIGRLPRKQRAHQVCNTVHHHEWSVGHSRIAVGSENGTECTLCGRCLQGCPIEVPWSPTTELVRLRSETPNFLGLSSAAVDIQLTEKQVQIKFADDSVMDFEHVLVASGWRTTPVVTARALGMGVPSIRDLEQSTLVMKPILFSSNSDGERFGSSFAFHDLVVAIPPNETHAGMTVQIYMPTPELAGRLFSQAPRMFHSLLRYFSKANKQPLHLIAQRIGIAMVFLDGGKWDTTKSDLGAMEKRIAPILREVLKPVGGHILPGFRVVLDRGRSEHVGSWAPVRGLVERVFSESWDLRAPSSRVIPIDTCLMPHIPAGSHTAIAATLARLVAQRVTQ